MNRMSTSKRGKSDGTMPEIESSIGWQRLRVNTLVRQFAWKLKVLPVDVMPRVPYASHGQLTILSTQYRNSQY